MSSTSIYMMASTNQALSNFSLKGLHPKFAIPVPKRIALLSKICFIWDYKSNPQSYCNPYYYVHWWIRAAEGGGEAMGRAQSPKRCLKCVIAPSSKTRIAFPFSLRLPASPIVRIESSALNPHPHPRVTFLSGQSGKK